LQGTDRVLASVVQRRTAMHFDDQSGQADDRPMIRDTGSGVWPA